MSLARPIRPGSRYLLTRRTAHRQFLLRPSDLTNQIVLYALAYATKVTGVLVHVFVAMSNHIHAVITDPEGRLPQFLHLLDRHIACCMNASLERTENFWASTPASVVALETDDDVIDKIAYGIVNPTAAGLVEKPGHWPGIMTPEAGMKITVARPGVFFRARGKMPASLDLEIAVPQLASSDGIEETVARLSERVEEKLCIARAAVAEANRTFLGREGVLATSWSDHASTPEAKRARQPRFAARDRAQRRSMRDRLRAFHSQYAGALVAWRGGNRAVIFPEGTYLMRVRHGVLVGDAPG